jgi:Rad3-related DNA helicase
MGSRMMHLMEIKISVRYLVEFLLRRGDIDNRRKGSPEAAMQEGSRIHRKLQRRMGAEYQAEVPLSYKYEREKYTLLLEGRADGIIDQLQEDGSGEIIIDEIKGTYRQLERMEAPIEVHLAQARCYAYMYGSRRGAEEMRIRMTYCHLITEEIRYFYEDITMEELEHWFMNLLEEYQKWADYAWDWRELRQTSIEALEFPFPYREGQLELISNVYQTVYHKKNLFLEAPTGVGKTISTIFPAVKAIGKSMGEKLFYLTAKTITRTVAEETFGLLREKRLSFKSIILTAKDKICFLEERVCNPEHCPYAKGHYDRVNDCVFRLLTEADSFTREKVEEYARRFTVCPYELSLDISLFADGIVCDYNYLFDPHRYLRRFFGDEISQEYLFLIDEAHNLLDRGREMYSAAIVKEAFMEFSGQLMEELSGSSMRQGRRARILAHKNYGNRLIHQLERCNGEFLAMKRQCEDVKILKGCPRLYQELKRLYAILDQYLDEQEEGEPPILDVIWEFTFELSHFLDTYELADFQTDVETRELTELTIMTEEKNQMVHSRAKEEDVYHYVLYSRITENGEFMVKLFCVDPSTNLRKCLNKGRSGILFSATLLPIQYYKKLLGGRDDDYEVYAKSVFQKDKLGLFIAGDVTSKYTRRTKEAYEAIAAYISEIVKSKDGNYMVFCPSYAFAQIVFDCYQSAFAREEVECIMQQEMMTEEEREAFLGKFIRREGSLVAFCVLGGIFGEGIDLKHERLIGSIIVGTGLPQVGVEKEILKDYFDAGAENGFDYSYRYPGMNKVLQAAGRVIRTQEDVGIVALLDERFLQYTYRRLFPAEWEEVEVVTLDTVAKRVERFWDSWWA